MASRSTILPQPSHLADLLSKVKIPPPRVPTVMDPASALAAVQDIGRFDQMKLQSYKRRIASTKKPGVRK